MLTKLLWDLEIRNFLISYHIFVCSFQPMLTPTPPKIPVPGDSQVMDSYSKTFDALPGR